MIACVGRTAIASRPLQGDLPESHESAPATDLDSRRKAFRTAGFQRQRLRHLHAVARRTGEQLERRRAALQGLPPHEIIGQHFSRFYTDEDRAAGMPAYALDTALTTGKFEAEGWRVRKDGTRFWASVVIDPIRDEAAR
jgi:PAS domain-containing protein